MREGWEYKKLGEVAKISSGKAIPSSDIVDTFSEGLYPCYGGNGLRGYVSHYSNDGFVPVIGRVGALCGNVHLPQEKFYATEHALVVILKTNDKPQFIEYLLSYLNLRQYAKGVAQPVLSASTLSEILIPVPPLSEQQRIVSELDLFSSIIEKKKAQLKEYDQLAQSIFYDMFGDPVTNEKGWEIKKLSESVQEMFLGPFGSALKVDSYVPVEESYCMVYEQKHAIQGTISLDNHFINIEKYELLKRFEVKPLDFIMSCRGTIGKIFQLPPNAPIGIIHPSLMKIRIREDVYDYAYFQFMLTKVVANESTNGNCVQMAITAKELGKKMLTLPPLSLQQSFASKIEAIERQKALVQQSITETETLFNCRMDYYFD